MNDEEYEADRQAKIASNKALLESLGLLGLKQVRAKRVFKRVKVEPSDRMTRLASSSITRKYYAFPFVQNGFDRRLRESESPSTTTTSSISTDASSDRSLGNDDSDYYDYEAERQAKIASNRALLESLGLVVGRDGEKWNTARQEKKVLKKAVASDHVTRRTSNRISQSARRNYRPFLDMSEKRRDSMAGFIVDKDDDEEGGEDDNEADFKSRKRKRFESSSILLRKSKPLGERLYSPKRFGAIPGVSVGTWWATRQECSTASVHAPFVAGISGNAEVGCYSLALSGGYADDIDLGETFTYTGSGGSVLQGVVNGKRLNLRTAPQTFNQSFKSNLNAALLTSSRTRKPIRVIRGYKSNSKWAPLEGYIYCGLYVCKRAWLADGASGFKVCRYAFERLPGQDPLPTPRAPALSPLRCSHANCCVEVVVTIDPKRHNFMM